MANVGVFEGTRIPSRFITLLAPTHIPSPPVLLLRNMSYKAITD